LFNLRSLDLNLLTVFEAIYEIGTVSGAAGRLALSKSATSHALSRLREACGSELFVRGGQGLSPTPAAAALYPAIRQALGALRSSLAEVTGFDPTQSTRRFRFSIPHPFGPFYALQLLSTATAVAPGIELTFDTTSRPRNLEHDLRDGLVDVAIDWLPARMDPLVNEKLFDDRLVIVARSGHPLIKGAPTIDDLRKQKFVNLHPRRLQADEVPQAIWQFFELGVHVALHVSELLEIPAVVANTDLLGIFMSSMGQLLQEQMGLKILAIPLELPALPVHLVWHESRRNDAAHRWLREMLVAQLSPPPTGLTSPIAPRPAAPVSQISSTTRSRRRRSMPARSI
jgi:DNA-binding transcriptional LysR family regulator